MKALIGILIIVVVAMGAWKIIEYYGQVKQDDEPAQVVSGEASSVSGESLPGLPYQLEASLKKAQEEGPKAFKQWLETYKKSPKVQDPRLAWIELDYVVLIGRTDPVEAKRVYADVRQRVGPDSPVYPRLKSLAKTYE